MLAGVWTRVVLFLAPNLAVLLVLLLVRNVLGIGRGVSAAGINLGELLVFSAVIGFTGAILSLLMSKMMAKWSTGARVIDNPSNSSELWLVSTVRQLAERAHIALPEVANYEGETNAFAPGAFQHSAHVAVCTGRLQRMNRSEIEAVLGPRIAPGDNGDSVTVRLVRGVGHTWDGSRAGGGVRTRQGRGWPPASRTSRDRA